MEYKGVKIHLTDNGEFYCDAVNNSPEYSKRQFNSFKFASIKKAIDDFEGSKVDKLFYKFDSYNCSVETHRQVSKKGTLLIFDDGKDSNHYSKRNLISSDDINEDSLKYAKELSDKMGKILDKIRELEDEKKDLRFHFKHINFFK